MLPAEWAPQDAVMLTWPHSLTDWAPLLPKVEPVYVQLVKTITRFESVLIVAHDDALKSAIIDMLSAADVAMDKVHFVVAPCNDTWARDHGPITVMENEGLTLLDFTFNGWGNKYPSALDNAINQALFNQAGATGLQYYAPDLVLEGGGIESDGEGTLLTTSTCLLNPNRNPSLGKADIEAKLTETLGASHLLWVENGYLEGDDTDSHIDTLVRLAPNNTLVYVACDDPSDPHFEALQAMEAELKAFKTPSGDSYRLIALPWPSAKYNTDGERLPATYANYLIINGAVLVPTYEDAHDNAALAAIAKAHPEREIIGIDCSAIIHQFGSLHCITMQLPQGFLDEA